MNIDKILEGLKGLSECSESNKYINHIDSAILHINKHQATIKNINVLLEWIDTEIKSRPRCGNIGKKKIRVRLERIKEMASVNMCYDLLEVK